MSGLPRCDRRSTHNPVAIRNPAVGLVGPCGRGRFEVPSRGGCAPTGSSSAWQEHGPQCTEAARRVDIDHVKFETITMVPNKNAEHLLNVFPFRG